ncbi:MAG TPA: hypothetical protein VMD07_05935 [Candidatus Acidoferrales bacterium]|nr:hypothetical protein [Candidatus Acidoferrales bacterium]
MKYSHLMPIIALIALSACSGSASTGAPSRLTPASQPAKAYGTLTVGTPKSGTAAVTRSGVRKPQYVSASTTFMTLWIDQADGGRVPCTGSTGSCTINWTSFAGTHVFQVTLDDSTSIAGGGYVLANGVANETLAAGSNALPTLTLNSVIGQIALDSETEYATGSGPYLGGFTGANYYAISVYVEDADGNLIEPPGDFEADGFLIGNEDGAFAAAFADFSPNNLGFVSDPTIVIGNPYNFYLSCLPGQTASDATLFAAYNLEPTDIYYSGLLEYSLTFPGLLDDDLLPTNGFPGYSCTGGTLSAVGPANGSITVQAHKKTP